MEIEGLFAEGEGAVGDVFFDGDFLVAEVAFAFLDVGLAFADGGVALAAEDGADAVELIKVGDVVLGGEGEFEGGLFEDAEGGVGELVLVAGEVLEEFVGSGCGVGCFFEVIDDGGAGVESAEGGVADGDAEVFLDEVDGLGVGVFLDPGDDLMALFEGEVVEGGMEPGMQIAECRLQIGLRRPGGRHGMGGMRLIACGLCGFGWARG